MKRFGPLLSLLLTGLTCNLPAAQLKGIDNFQIAAARTNPVLGVPDFERTPDALTASVTDAIAKGNSALDQIASQNLLSRTASRRWKICERNRASSRIVPV